MPFKELGFFADVKRKVVKTHLTNSICLVTEIMLGLMDSFRPHILVCRIFGNA